ncbi:PD40 domain-containing protein, partial [bacterium]|nr:PD40 domain-containing protein [bacterium]
MKAKYLLSVFVFLTGIFVLQASAAANNYMMRFPDIYGNSVVFVSGEDIWKAPAGGGEAVRLTINDGSERFPKFSPDGSLIAFTGEYDGNSDVYVMNADGGSIKRLTYHPGYDEMVGWNSVNNTILFRSSRDSYSRFYRLYEITPDEKNIKTLILHEASQGSFSPDGKKIAYNRMSRETRTWKRYKGGTAQNIYLYDFDKQKETKLTTYKGTDRIPMWMGDKIYFSSDRDRHLNIYYYDTNTQKIEQVTHHDNYDIRRPSMGSGKIVYELGGKIYLLDPQSGQNKEIPIVMAQDAPEARPYLKNVEKEITGIGISPKGKRALIVARGEVFTAPKEHGEIRNLTQSSGARDRGAVWSPDGKTIAYVSDENGEYQVYITSQDGKHQARQLTNYKNGYLHGLKWAPDSKKIAFTDHTNTLRFIDIEKEKIVTIDKADYENIDVSLDKKPISDFNWSPDSRYIAYSKMNADILYQIYIYSLVQKKIFTPSNGIYNDFCPTFSTDGRHLFFISNRRFSPTYGDFEWEMVYKNVAGIYNFSLTKDAGSLLPFRSDEALEKKKKKEETKTIKVDIDFAGLSERVEALPLPKGNYRYLSVNKSSLFYLNKDKGDFNRFEFRKVGSMNLYAFSFEDRKEHAVIEKINTYKLSTDGKYIVYKKGKNVGIIKSGEKKSKGEKISLEGLTMMFNPREEWQQIFNEAWRLERDYYYEPNMHGLDWDAMKIKYSK